MRTVNISEAKASLSRLVKAVETGEEREIIIARNGRPAVRLVALAARPVGPRIGVAAGQFVVPESLAELDEEIARLFNGE